MADSLKCCLPARFTAQNVVVISSVPHACYMTRKSHSPLSERPNDV